MGRPYRLGWRGRCCECLVRIRLGRLRLSKRQWWTSSIAGISQRWPTKSQRQRQQFGAKRSRQPSRCQSCRARGTARARWCPQSSAVNLDVIQASRGLASGRKCETMLHFWVCTVVASALRRGRALLGGGPRLRLHIWSEAHLTSCARVVDMPANTVAKSASVFCSVVTIVASVGKSSAKTAVRNVMPFSASGCVRTARILCLVPKEVRPAVPSDWSLGSTINWSKTEGSLANQPLRLQECGTLTTARESTQLPAQARLRVHGAHGATAT